MLVKGAPAVVVWPNVYPFAFKLRDLWETKQLHLHSTEYPFPPIKISYLVLHFCGMQRKISNVRRTKYQNISDFYLVLELPLPNQLKPTVQSRMQM